MLIVFFIQLFAAELIFTYKMKARKYFWLRILLGCLLSVGIQYGYDSIVNAVFPEELPHALYLSLFVLQLITSTAVLYISFDCSLSKAVLCGTAGYAVQNCAYWMLVIFRYVTGINIQHPTDIEYLNTFINLVLYAVCYTPFFIWIYRQDKRKEEVEVPTVSTVVVSVLIVLLTIVMSSYIPFGKSSILYYIYSVVSCLLVIAIQCGLFSQSALKKENETIRHLLQAEWKQHLLAKDQIETINIKCHDLKHQINVLLSVEDVKEREALLAEVKNAISIYDDVTHTGNETLDIVLTEKKLFCEKYAVRLYCMIEGKALSFMTPMDISSLFGNALDNAIESVKEQENVDNRFIELNVKQRGNLVTVHIENYCSTPVTMNDGVPKTTKGDNINHGFGVKSIRYIVEKYKGNLLIGTGDNKFTLDMLFLIKDAI